MLLNQIEEIQKEKACVTIVCGQNFIAYTNIYIILGPLGSTFLPVRLSDCQNNYYEAGKPG